MCNMWRTEVTQMAMRSMAMRSMAMFMPLRTFNFSRNTPLLISTTSRFLNPHRCTPLQQVQQPQKQEDEAAILCDLCNGKGWLICDFCKGQKTNVKSENNRIYRRCPSCRAIGCVLCSRCKVFKCVTFPNFEDGEDLTF